MTMTAKNITELTPATTVTKDALVYAAPMVGGDRVDRSITFGQMKAAIADITPWDMTGASVDAAADPAASPTATWTTVTGGERHTALAPLNTVMEGFFASVGLSTVVDSTATFGAAGIKATLPTEGDTLAILAIGVVEADATPTEIAAALGGSTDTRAMMLLAIAVFGGNVVQLGKKAPGEALAFNNMKLPGGEDNAVYVSDKKLQFGLIMNADAETGGVVVVLEDVAGPLELFTEINFPAFTTEKQWRLVSIQAHTSETTPVYSGTQVIDFSDPIVMGEVTVPGFVSQEDAVLPVGATDGDVFEVTGAGAFGGTTTLTGDYVTLVDGTTKIIAHRQALPPPPPPNPLETSDTVENVSIYFAGDGEFGLDSDTTMSDALRRISSTTDGLSSNINAKQSAVVGATNINVAGTTPATTNMIIGRRYFFSSWGGGGTDHEFILPSVSSSDIGKEIEILIAGNFVFGYTMRLTSATHNAYVFGQESGSTNFGGFDISLTTRTKYTITLLSTVGGVLWGIHKA